MAKLKRMNSLDAGVFVTINRTDGKGKKKERGSSGNRVGDFGGLSQ
jgi:hypothetical protein